jgi:uncharacterized protein YdeI (YjbR/CyaY-like superfamily)
MRQKRKLVGFTRDRREWRAWLEERRWRSGKPRVGSADAVAEALCVGWIDSRPNALDDERYMRLFSPRKPRSLWSKLNKERVERLIAQRLTVSAGMEKVELARRNGTWEQYDTSDELTTPNDRAAALAENPDAQRNFDAFPPSSKKNLLWWIISARRPETRLTRMEEAVRLAA